MAKNSMNDQKFESLLARINMETDSVTKKLDILFESRGFFSPQQAAIILYAIPNPADKVRAIRIIESRLCRMTCSQARDVLCAVSIHNDRHLALEAVKRFLVDSQSREGTAQILSAFVFEDDKYKALRILKTVRSDVEDLIPAGGHQGYAALGGLYTQCRPMVPHLYGDVREQEMNRPFRGKIEIPVQAKTGVLPSMYTGHPSYAYPPGRDYATDRGYPGFSLATPPAVSNTCPAGELS